MSVDDLGDHYVMLSCNTHADITDEDYQRHLVETWHREFPELFPTHANWYEPLKPVKTVEDILHYFRPTGNFIWERRKQIKGRGGSFPPDKVNYPEDMGRFYAEYEWQEKYDWRRLISVMASASESDHAWLHVYSDKEFKNQFSRFHDEWIRKYLAKIDIRSWLQPLHMLSWSDWFSAIFCERKFGHSPHELARRISQQVPEVIIEADEKHLRLQLTESLADVLDDFEAFDAVRQKVYDVLGRHNFMAAMDYPPMPSEFAYTRLPGQERRVILWQAMDGLAHMLCEMDGSPALPVVRPEDCARLDFSLDSLRVLDAIIDRSRQAELDEETTVQLVLRAGAYVGEVLRRHTHPWLLTWRTHRQENINWRISGALVAEDLLQVVVVLVDRVSLPKVIRFGDTTGLVFPLAWVRQRLQDASAPPLHKQGEEFISKWWSHPEAPPREALEHAWQPPLI